MPKGKKKSEEIEVQSYDEGETPEETSEKKGKDAPKGRVKPIVIKPLKIEIGHLTLRGTSPLLVNSFDVKSRQELDEMYQEGLNAKERKLKREDKTRERKTPQQEFEASLYPMPGKKGKYGIPAAGIKKCAVTAASLSNVPMSVATKAFHIVGDEGGLIEIKGGKPVIDERMVRVGPFGNKKPATRRRGRFDTWEITFAIKYRQDLISTEQLCNLYESAGFSVGLCEYRPEKGGNLGMFEVKR